MPSTMDILEIDNLRTYYRTDDQAVARAVDGVNFRVQSGRTLALVGESGCGKSQTAFSIMRLLDRNGYHPEGSSVRLEGDELLTRSDHEMQHIRGNRMAMIFQEPMASLNPLWRVGNQLSEPLRLHQGLTRSAARERGIDLLRQVGIPDPESRIDNFPHEMSGGMKQRVMIAMALACRPKLLIADEPTTALDVTIQAQILRLIQDLQRETGMGVLLITHDLGVVRQMADDVCVMYAGKVAETGTREQIFSHPSHPYTRALLSSIPRQAERGKKLATIPGTVPSATDYPAHGCRFCDRCPVSLEQCGREDPGIFPGLGGEGHLAVCHLLETQRDWRNPDAGETADRLAKPPASGSLLEVKALKTHFPVKRGLLQRTVAHVRAVDGVTFSLRRGETVALVGESGCGKTTVGQSILRLTSKASGEVRYGGVDLLDLGAARVKAFRKKLQIVFQDPFTSLSPRMRVRDIILEGLTIHEPGLSEMEREQRLRDVMDQVRLSQSVENRYPYEFSGGQRQRIAIARALVLNPDLLILDEPTSALDVSVQAQILNLLEDIQRERGLAYLFITHDLGVVEYLADQVAVMYLGRIVEMAPTAELFRNPQHPYTRALLEAVPRIDAPRQEFNLIEGDVPSPLNPPRGCHFHPRCPLATDECRATYPKEIHVGSTRVSCHAVIAAHPDARQMPPSV